MSSKLHARWAMSLVVGAATGGLWGCGGQPNELDPNAPKNTPLEFGSISGPKTYTYGAAQLYSILVRDPDGIKAVSATLDGAAISINLNGLQYDLTFPVGIAVGSHTLLVRATGLAPDGSSEIPQTFTQVITVLRPNTPLTLGMFSGPISYTFGPSQAYRVTVTDPDGIASVQASLDGVSLPAAASGDDYLITVPAGTAAGSHLITVMAAGKQPDGSNEPVQSRELSVSIVPAAPVDTPLALSAVAETLVVGNAVFTVTVTDPDGVASVSATLDGNPIPLSVSGSNYSYSIYYFSVHPGPHTFVFTAIGLAPDGSATAPQSVSYFIP
ncbi:hypothetical protein [Rhodoferax sp.]|uniref:hypothetical protein n=1 Tax=Rhodoferax sp. TaxID=50421 RepID=UPI0027781549|nr:hypothetical protein [Rhodoferax sp.]